jgi:hypothetical protein
MVQLDDHSFSIEKQHVDRETHTDRMDRFFSPEQQPFAGTQWGMSQETPESPPGIIRHLAILNQGRLSSEVHGAHA